MARNNRRKALNAIQRWLLMIIGVVLFGVAGYMIIEGLGVIDALYMAVITITTVGYQEVQPPSPAGKIFSIIFIITSFSTFTFVLARVTQLIASGQLAYYFVKKRLMQELDKMNGHVIVCGYGRNGRQAAKTLRAHKLPFVIIEKDAETMKHYKDEDPSLLYLADDATEDEVLLHAGIERASAILVTLPEDADNVFIVLSARSLNPSIQIISRASRYSATPKLYKAGASHVVMPDLIGGTHMATLVSKPDVIEFLEFLSGEDGEAIYIEAVGYEKLPSSLRDQPLKQVMEWKKTGVNCIGIKDEGGKFCINPSPELLVAKGMKVIVLGTREQISEMKKNVGE